VANNRTSRSGSFCEKTAMTKRIWLLSLVLFLVLSLVFVGKYLIHRKSGPKANNVLLISIDTCRADYLGCYGGEYNATPNIDAFAKEGILFEKVVTPVPLTLPAHSSMLTGLYPTSHGVHGNLDYKLEAEHVTLAEVLKRKGYHTGAIVSSYVLDSTFGLDQGFDEYDDDFENVVKTSHYTERRGDEATERALEWLENNKGRPWFLFLHYYDPHWRYEPPEPFKSKFSMNLYAGEIAYVDYHLEKVLDKLKKLGVYDSTVIILTADHGEMLGEHGEADHGYFIYNSAVYVPLILRVPGNTGPERVISTVSINDILPTVCQIIGVDSPEGMSGYSLLRDVEKGESDRHLYCESYVPAKHRANVLLGLITQKWKYIQTTHPELYDLESDWQEQNNLCEAEPKRAHFLREHLREMLQTTQKDSYKNIELSDEQRRKLESLGYIGSVSVDASIAFDTNKPDPKEYIKFHNIKA
jgi:arylsulfatase A-like enzyme